MVLQIMAVCVWSANIMADIMDGRVNYSSVVGLILLIIVMVGTAKFY